MTNLFWPTLGIISIILLIVFWGRRNAVWGGFTLGIVIGFIITIFYFFKGDGFSWFIIAKGGILGTMAGLVAELLGKISDKIRNKSRRIN